MKGINNREGLFGDDDLKQLDGGYSVSETEDNMSHLNDMLSRGSALVGVGSPGI